MYHTVLLESQFQYLIYFLKSNKLSFIVASLDRRFSFYNDETKCMLDGSLELSCMEHMCTRALMVLLKNGLVFKP